MNLIPNWQSSWRFTSVQAALLLGFIDACYAAEFFGLRELLGVNGFALLNAVMAAVVIPALRIKQQSAAPVSPDVKEALVMKAEAVPVKPVSNL